MHMAGVIACFVAILTVSSVVGVSAVSPTGADEPQIVADLDGRTIDPDLISSFYCHDLDYPNIHCFRDPAQLEAAEMDRETSFRGSSANFSATTYVTIFDGNVWTGPYMDISQNYDVLFSIGWNDRISSYKVRNSASGTFWTDWYASGTGRNFCCNTQVSSLPSGLDDAFSSVYRR